MKKTFKIFCRSFALSSFAIWVANELFFSVAPSAVAPVSIPKKNIALFFEGGNSVLPALETKRVTRYALEEIARPAADNYELPEQQLPVWDEAQFAESFVDDVADIPLEYGSMPKKRVQKQAPKTAELKQAADRAVGESAKNTISESAKNTVTESAENTLFERQENHFEEKAVNLMAENKTAGTIELASVELPAPAVFAPLEEDSNDDSIIPLENAAMPLEKSRVEVIEEAPRSQLAMMDTGIAIDSPAITQNNREEKPQERAWHSMDESEDSPWVVAKSNRFAKNAKAVEDYSAVKSESEIENLLSPAKIEEDGEYQTAEMVKNILIPIPEDILNDKNLTPQLVSSKKSYDDGESEEEDTEEVEESSSKGGFLKSFTSIFGGSSDEDGEDDGDEEEESSRKSNRKGLFAAFSKDKTATKILPAEMKLSFQPGRAEISGQTLRWIQAFANKAVEEPDVVLEIRIDKNSSYALQQRRLDLLHTILDSKGIGDDKVNTVFTSREPNSFIIRTLRLSENTRGKSVKNNQRQNSNYQMW